MKYSMMWWGFLLFYCKGVAQPLHLQVSNDCLTTGAYSNNFTDAFSFIANPACLSGTEVFSLGLMTERKWMLPELGIHALSGSFPLRKGGVGIAFQRSGDASYNEQAMELAYGKKLGRVELGIRFHFLQTGISGYPGYGFGNAGVGIRVHLSENLTAGWTLDLPVFGGAGKTNRERGPQAFSMGFGYEWNRNLFLSFLVEKSMGSPHEVTGSVTYRYSDQFFFSFGMMSSRGSPVFESGWKKNQLCIQIYVSYESVLGFSPGLVFLWKGKTKSG